ncbi:MAG: amidohydrolase family protein [Chloroflexi bacterium]|nr:amidohydrolase family protein [Chloroflexota bacterium]
MELAGIDIHVHLNDEMAAAASGLRGAQMARYFGSDRKTVSVDELADQYRARNMMAVLMNTTDVTTSGITPVPNDHIADAVRRNPDVFIGFGVIEPQMGSLAKDEVRRCAEELGLKGLGELNPGRQRFMPNDPTYYPLWAEAARHKLVLLFHGGMMGSGAGTPGGMGYKLKYGHPLHLDDVAADFPELQIIGAHPAWPWQSDSLAVARHKGNYYIDLSGWAPKYFSPELIQYATTILQDKCLFGSDSPVLSPERWLQEFGAIEMKPEVRRKIMVDNARRLLGLAE